MSFMDDLPFERIWPDQLEWDRFRMNVDLTLHSLNRAEFTLRPPRVDRGNAFQSEAILLWLQRDRTIA
jgi:hypothetical protein